MGYTLSHSRLALEHLFTRKCIEGKVFDVPFDIAGDEIRITALGRYHVTSLVDTFVYLDAIVIDTPILDTTVRASIRDVQTIRDRLRRGRDFLRYLDSCAEHLRDADAKRIWLETHTRIASDITDIETEQKS
jgi:hypothetical protein